MFIMKTLHCRYFTLYVYFSKLKYLYISESKCDKEKVHKLKLYILFLFTSESVFNYFFFFSKTLVKRIESRMEHMASEICYQ